MQLYHAGLVSKIANTEKQILNLLKSDEHSVLLTQMDLYDLDAIELLLELRDRHLELPVVVLVNQVEQNKSMISLLNVDALMEAPFHVQHIVKTVSQLAAKRFSLNSR